MPIAAVTIKSPVMTAALRAREPKRSNGITSAKKMIGECGGQIAKDLVVLDVYRDHRDLKPSGIAELNEEGKQLARAVADTVVRIIDQVVGKSAGGENA